ncbi:tyrosine--tRNA ligase [Iodobacter sp. CM08]|uniref:tyrosine--tRNA ligase n=1 Tax=Iodobacter sp. CM08 TaxID=3085902 RepID=UPI002981FB97|nr:tyrosine--tRNA ligase [Iodobacter sp. CM08]MDW5415079.1 tyrosine--tRNA ligase [Iodobacter sp. CM08]
MKESNLISQLQERGLIAQVTDAEALDALLAQKSITLYCGFDPTADSLHLGHLVPLLALKRFQMAGHRPLALVGGATGMIGDPSFKATERSLNTPDVVAGWVDKIRKQVSPFLDFDCGANSAAMVNNNDWFAGMDVLSFLRDIGKHFSVNAMINKESVKQRLNRDEVGISFTEFAYSLLQSYDFAVLNKSHDCQLQLGGSDQWGNITAGIDLTRRMNQQQVFGITMPLITKSDGTKFGKSEGNAIWLDPSKCSPYKFYQFWLSTTDDDVYRFMKYFTFMSLAEIDAIEAADRASGSAPQAQRILAEHATELVHGKAALEAAKRISQNLFAEDQSALTEEDFQQLALDGVHHIELGYTETSLADALVAAELASSKTQARSFIESDAVSINGQKVSDVAYHMGAINHCFGSYTLLRRGKKNHCLIVWK